MTVTIDEARLNVLRADATAALAARRGPWAARILYTDVDGERVDDRLDSTHDHDPEWRADVESVDEVRLVVRDGYQSGFYEQVIDDAYLPSNEIVVLYRYLGEVSPDVVLALVDHIEALQRLVDTQDRGRAR